MPDARDVPSMRTITSVRDETPTVRTLEFKDDSLVSAPAGRFVMVWIPGTGELPMSIMISEENNAALTVRKHGATSSALYDMKQGDTIGIRGPYGNSFDVQGKNALLVGGGTGLVPLMRMISQIRNTPEVTLLIGARTHEEVFFEDMAARMSAKVVVTTDDGSYGLAGSVADEAARLISSGRFDSVYTCGPEPMMKRTVNSALEHDIFVQASIERVMKCGIGICGSCSFDADIVCCDGTVFDGKRLAASSDFGVSYRAKSGTITRY